MVRPWFVSGAKVVYLKEYIQPDGSHRTRIFTMRPDVQKEIIDRLKFWLR
ncbi:MAG: hypothetical protein H6Q12_1105 [Bacteroidetes bacterium]|nr:hypothetical protein [Bacteroidota bacterium]